MEQVVVNCGGRGAVINTVSTPFMLHSKLGLSVAIKRDSGWRDGRLPVRQLLAGLVYVGLIGLRAIVNLLGLWVR